MSAKEGKRKGNLRDGILFGFSSPFLNGKIWIQYDGTIRPVAEALLAAGIPREAIVLGFHPANVRQYTDFAVA
jgi:hypothetical protein